MSSDPYDGFPAGFFDRVDDTSDAQFYAAARLVTHIDDRAIAALGPLYEQLVGTGNILDLMSSWISHLTATPESLTILGMNAEELAANPAATARVVHDLNADPTLPFDDRSFDGAICTVSADYLTKPIEVFTEVRRVVRPGAAFVCSFSNRCFPTKAILGWRSTDDTSHCELIAEYFRRTGWDDPHVRTIYPPMSGGDPLWAVWATSPATAR